MGPAGEPPTFSGRAAVSTGSAAAAIERAAHELAATSSGYAPTGKPPLLVASPARTVARRRAEGSLATALLAAAGAAFVGGLLWAGVVIGTRYDIGFLAWFVGAATGGVAFRIVGGPIRGAARLVLGLIAAGGIMVGKYVIFVHDLNKALHSVPLAQGLSVHYLDTYTMSVFIHHFGSVVRPIYGLWALFAFAGAVLKAHGRTTLGRR